MKKHLGIKKVAFLGLCTALALLLAYVESLIPPIFAAVPGIKMGLPNIVILYVLYSLDVRYAATVSLVRLCISSMLFGNAMAFAYSLAGAVLSLAVMWALKKTNLLSGTGVSVAGGICHNIGQVLVAMVLLDTPQIAYYMLVLSVTGIIAGIFVGICGGILVKRVPVGKMFKF